MFNALLVVLVAASVVGAALMGRAILRLPARTVVRPVDTPGDPLDPDQEDSWNQILANYEQTAHREGDA